MSQKTSSIAEAESEAPAARDGKLRRKEYLKELEKLQTELCIMQEWVKETGQRIIVVFEGRDAAGKGGIIRALTERVSPRVFQVVALSAPTKREKSQLYLQRYLKLFPAAGEVIIFDRSWYNRAGVERVMGFCTPKECKRFLEWVPKVEEFAIGDGIILIKYWLEVGEAEQKRRFEARIDDPQRQWKLSPVDLPSRERWYDYSRARDDMLDATDTAGSPWHIVQADDKKRARLNCIADLLTRIPYKKIDRPKVKLPERSEKHAYDDKASMRDRRWVAAKY